MPVTVVPTSWGETPVTTNDSGAGRPVLLLHGGAGPISVARFAEMLVAEGDARVIVPIHPGFQGTPRPEGLTSVRGLGELYSELLNTLDLRQVTVIGNSVGGWIAAELAVRQNPRVERVVLADAGGLEVAGHPPADFFSLNLEQVTELSYRHPERFRIDPSRFTDAQRAAMAGNRAALKVYSGAGFTDPTLLGRLSAIRVPTLVVWGAAERIFPREHADAYARAIPGSRLVVIEDAGHLPQMETPEQLLGLVREFRGA